MVNGSLCVDFEICVCVESVMVEFGYCLYCVVRVLCIGCL